MRRLSTLLLTALMVGALLAGCNLPFLQRNAGATQTSAALTVEARLTELAPATTPTLTAAPFPTLPPVTATIASSTAASASSCDQAQFVSETVLDNSVIAAGDGFVKTWTLKNIGTCSWTPSYALVFVSGDVLNGPAAAALLGNVNPGQTVTLSVNLKAPTADGTYHGNWGLRNGAGVIFSGFWVQIVVGSGGGGTPGAFAVTHVAFSYGTSDNGSYLNCPTVSAQITVNAGGDVQYHWTRSDGAVAPVQTIHFGAAGTQTVSESWYLPTAAGVATRWLGIYIDSPNHQDFGHQTFTSTCTSP